MDTQEFTALALNPNNAAPDEATLEGVLADTVEDGVGPSPHQNLDYGNQDLRG